jgi:uncharacterized damage-inducible protein DinB
MNMLRDVQPLPGYAEPYGLMCAMLQDATRDWRGEIPGNLSAEAMTWRVRPGGQSMGTVMLHIIGVELFWIEHFVLERPYALADVEALKLREIDVDEGAWPDAPSEDLAWYFELHDRYRQRFLEAVREFPDADLQKARDGEDWKYTPRWVLNHVIQHETYHGGQIALLHDLWMRRG